MGRLIFLILFLSTSFFSVLAQNEKTEIVFCVDLSASTNGLIREFNKSFYPFLNTISGGKSAQVKVGFMAYGRNSFTKEANYIKKISDLSKRFDLMTFSLLKLPESIESAQAYIDLAIDQSIDDMNWSSDTSVRKELIVLGNGGFRSKELEKTLKKARKKGIEVRVMYVNTLNNMREMNAWEKLMKKFKVTFVIIEFDNSPIQFEKHYDEQWLLTAGMKLRDTYIYYGEEGKEFFHQMDSIDQYTALVDATCHEERLLFKCSSYYQGMNAHWDLVDLYNKGKLDLKNVDKTFLPEYLQGLSDEQLEIFIKLKSGQRQQVLEQLFLEQQKLDVHHQRKQMKSEQFQSSKRLSVVLISWFS